MIYGLNPAHFLLLSIKLYWNATTTICLCIVQGCYCATMVETKTTALQNLNSLLFVALFQNHLLVFRTKEVKPKNESKNMHKFSSLIWNTSGLECRYYKRIPKSFSSSQNKKHFKSVDICKVCHSNGKEYGAMGCRLSLSLTKITLSGDLMTLPRQLIFITSFSLCPC